MSVFVNKKRSYGSRGLLSKTWDRPAGEWLQAYENGIKTSRRLQGREKEKGNPRKRRRKSHAQSCRRVKHKFVNFKIERVYGTLTALG
jgi:hypothetical protein